MIVTYTPPLMDQIRARRRQVVVIRAPQGFVQQVDPETRQATGVPQQFQKLPDGALQILPPAEWVLTPTILDVGSVRLG